jgi:pathogenesis-related protein 1
MCEEMSMRYGHSGFILLGLTFLLSAACVNQQQVKVVASKPVVAPVAGTNGLDGDEEQAVLSYHNEVRASVNVPPLVWSKELSQHATAWGATLAANGCSLDHSQDSNYGENLFIGSLSLNHEAVVEAAKSWESEKINYSGEPLKKANSSQVGHYTQMVWRNTTELGCAKVSCNSDLIVVCNYNPVGNYMGKKPY